MVLWVQSSWWPEFYGISQMAVLDRNVQRWVGLTAIVIVFILLL